MDSFVTFVTVVFKVGSIKNRVKLYAAYSFSAV